MRHDLGTEPELTPSSPPSSEGERSNAKLTTVGRLLAVTFGMFLFGFALAPLYDVVCEVTGLNGKTGVVAASDLPAEFDIDREVQVQFVASVGVDNWEFYPLDRTMSVTPGQLYETRYFARNPNSSSRTAQAVPSVAPFEASRYFNKTECFCFSNQAFEPGEGKMMPVRFVVDPKLPSEIELLTLSYTFFEIEGG